MAFSSLALNVKVCVKPDRCQDFLKVIEKDAQQTLLTEPGAIQFTVGQDVEQGHVFYFHEQYQTMEDFDHHKTTSHFMEWLEFQKTDPFLQDPVVDIFYLHHKKKEEDDDTPKTSTTTPVVPLTTQGTFCLNVQLCIQPQVREEFLQVIENNQRGSRESEPLCLQYDFGENVNTPNVFHFHEQYTGNDAGKEGFHAHAASPHFAIWKSSLPKVTLSLPRIPLLNSFAKSFKAPAWDSCGL